MPHRPDDRLFMIPAKSTDFTFYPVFSAMLFCAAVVLAVFYHGPQITLLTSAQVLLICWLGTALIAGYTGGVRIPRTWLALSIAAFWVWLGVSLAWSRVPATSVMNFWWVGSFALVFWIYTLAPARDRIFRLVGPFVLFGAVALSLYACVQLFGFNRPPVATFVNLHSFAALLMLVAIPACGYFLLAPAGSRRLWALGAALLLVFFTIAATQGRGTTISLIAALAVLVGLAYRHVPRARLGVLVALVAGAYTGANLILHGALSDRLMTLADPGGAGSPRFLIWRGSWAMLQDSPWYGIGLGTYYLAWPPYRHPADSSLGFFAHNDYLQLAIEIGLPGLALLVAALVAVLWLLLRMLRTQPPAPIRIEVAAIFCGLLAIAIHSFLDFNFYILPTSIVAGLLLGRYQELAVGAAARDVVWLPARALQRPTYAIIVVLLLLLPVSYLFALGLADYFYQHGQHQARQGLLQEADSAFTYAERLVPADDRTPLAHADLFRHAITRLPPDAVRDRRALYDEALRFLALAETANPYRAMAYSLRGVLYQQNPSFAGEHWRELAIGAYRAALKRNPRFFYARLAYAHLLLQGQERDAARAVLEPGIEHWYYPEPALVDYYNLTARLRRETGDAQGAARVEAKRDEAKALLAARGFRTLPAAPVVPIAGSGL